MKFLKYLKIFLFTLLFSPIFLSVVYASEDESKSRVFKGEVLTQKEVSCGDMVEGLEYSCISYEVKILDGEYLGKEVSTMPTWVNNEEDFFKVGSKVYISYGEDIQGNEIWSIESYSKEGQLLSLFLIFVILIIVITGIRGLRATFGLSITFFVLYFFAVPRINMGESILLISGITLFILLCASTFVTYGFNIKSLISFTSTFLGILFIIILGYLVISKLNISGSGEESAAMLYESTEGMIKLSNIFLLSIVIGALGVLDDVTIGQASSIIELYTANKQLTSKELFKRSMNIGRDHISSMVNTLFVAYAGSSFSLIMLLSANNPDFRILINTGFVVEEIVRTLVASIGLVLVVPLTSFLASKIVVRVLK